MTDRTDTSSPINSNPNPNPEASAGVTPVEGPAFKASLDSLRNELSAMPEGQILRKARIDPTVACAIAMAAASKLTAFRAPLVSQFGAASGTLVDSLRSTALATRQADIELTAAEEATDLSPLHREVSAAYTLLITDADALINRGYLPKERLEHARDIQGYQASLDSLLLLIAVLREHWGRIAGHGLLAVADIDRAELVALRMSAAISSRDHGAFRAPAAELRARALSKLIRDYDQIRRMMSYLRWEEGDVDETVPSLYAGRGGRKPKTDVADSDEDDVNDEPELVGRPVIPGAPSPTNGGGPFTA